MSYCNRVSAPKTFRRKGGNEMNVKSLLLLVPVGLTSGCALTSGSDRQSLYSPPGIHPSTTVESDASISGQVPIAQYYAALTAAQVKGSTEIFDFVDKGIGLTSAYCLRWFQRLDDVQRRMNLQEKNFNVLRELGTVFLGIGNAIPNWVTGYGAVNTAYSGIAGNFNESILTGPTTSKIKSQVLAMLRQSEVELRKDVPATGATITFTQAYSRLEMHADTCTYSTVRGLLDTTLATADASRNPVTGKISVANVIAVTNLQPANEQQIIDIRAINLKVKALSEDTTKLVEINRVLKDVGAQKSDFTSFADAAKSLEMLFRDVKPADMQKWNNAIK